MYIGDLVEFITNAAYHKNDVVELYDHVNSCQFTARLNEWPSESFLRLLDACRWPEIDVEVVEGTEYTAVSLKTFALSVMDIRPQQAHYRVNNILLPFSATVYSVAKVVAEVLVAHEYPKQYYAPPKFITNYGGVWHPDDLLTFVSRAYETKDWLIAARPAERQVWRIWPNSKEHADMFASLLRMAAGSGK